jgi:molybdopterin/thiamine biosynthesis adenylyltransferase
MRRYRLKIAENDFEQLRSLVLADMPSEAGAFLLAGWARCGGTEDILIRRVVPIPKEDFVSQHEYRLEVSARAVNGLAALCEVNGLGAVLCHSHPTAIPYSPSDDYGERRIFDVLRNFIPPNGPIASLLVWPEGIDARVWLPRSNHPIRVDEVAVVGRSIRKIPLGNMGRAMKVRAPEIFSRQVLAFGEEGQKAITRSRVAIVGVGGTGSVCAEQLARLGVQEILLIDPDTFEPSNVTRVYGSFAANGRPRPWRFKNRRQPKADIVAEHLRRINPEANIKAVRGHAAETRVARLLLDRDVIFLCTDDHWGRAIVNQISHQYLIPSINLGVRIDAREGNITGAAGGLDILRPDLPCLWCKKFLSSKRIAAESMPKEERKGREREGYVEGLDTPAPSVISLNTTSAGFAVTAFIQLVTDFMAEGGEISRLNYQILEGTVSRGTSQSENVCVCKTTRGFGDLKPMQTVEDLRHLYYK